MALVFTRHARKRALERGIRIDEIHGAAEAPTVVEEYAGDTILVTLYEPDLERWEPGFVRRRPKR